MDISRARPEFEPSMSPIRAEHDPNTSQTLYELAPYMGREHAVQEPNANRR